MATLDSTTSPPVDADASDVKYLQCTEVWGGMETVDRPLQTQGLQGRVYSRPYHGAVGGGDVHYISSCGSGQFSRWVLADVSGHGEQVMQTASRLRQLMRRHVVNHSQAWLVRSVNREFAALTEPPPS